MASYFIAHDIGTSGDKASLVSVGGKVERCVTVPYGMNVYKSNWAEEDPEDWWKAFCEGNKAILNGIDKTEVAAICISGQMMTGLPVDENCKALHPAMIFIDGRAEKETSFIREKMDIGEYYKRIGTPPSANYSLPKIMWLKNNHPEIYEKTYKFLVSKDYINARLTGVFATDGSDADFMHMYDMRTGEWSNTILTTFGIDREKLPDILSVGKIIGTVLKNIEEECGLAAGTPVVMGMGDGTSSSVGIGLTKEGDGYTSVGTSSWVGVATESLKLDSTYSMSKMPYYRSDLFLDFGSMQAGGLSLSWFKDVFCAEEQRIAKETGKDVFTILSEEVEEVPAGANGLLYIPYLAGERCPWWDSEAKAVFLGLKTTTTHADVTKAVIEGVALHLGLILNRVRDLSPVKNMRIAGGGAKSPIWRQVFADVYNMPVTKTNITDQAGALGSAVIAGVGTGVYDSYEVINDFHKVESVTEPIEKNVKLYQSMIDILKDSYQATKDINHRLSAL